MKQMICTKCNYNFNIKDNLKFKVTDFHSFIKLLSYRETNPLFDGIEHLEKANVVVCPMCSNEMLVNEYKFFGVITLRNLRRIIIFILLTIICFALVIRGR